MCYLFLFHSQTHPLPRLFLSIPLQSFSQEAEQAQAPLQLPSFTDSPRPSSPLSPKEVDSTHRAGYFAFHIMWSCAGLIQHSRMFLRFSLSA